MNATHPLCPKRVLLLTASNNAYTRGVIAGVAAVARLQSWHVSLLLIVPIDAIPFEAFDGVLSTTSAGSPALEASGLPAVMCSGARKRPGLPCVISDNSAIGRLAAEHLLERGLSEFVCFGPGEIAMSTERMKSFSATVQAAGARCRIFDQMDFLSHRQLWLHGSARAGEMIDTVPKPAGVFAVTDELAHGLVGMCRGRGLRIPDDLAIVGVNNDEVLAGLSQPPLSSVIPDAFGIGQTAATLLGKLMEGELPSAQKVEISPLGVETRQSTDILAVRDAKAAEAYRFIHANAHRPLEVGEVCRAVAVSRRSLERRFRAAFERTLLTEIRNAHIGRAKHLLVTTDLPLAEISERCGFCYPENFHAAFKRVCRTTPAAFRKASAGSLYPFRVEGPG